MRNNSREIFRHFFKNKIGRTFSRSFYGKEKKESGKEEKEDNEKKEEIVFSPTNKPPYGGLFSFVEGLKSW